MSIKTDKAKKSPSVSSVKPSPKPASPKTSKAVGIPPKATPRKVIPAKTPVPAPDIPIKVLLKGSLTSLSDTGVLDYEIGSDDAGETCFRVVANNAGGFFSQEWVAWSKIFAACNASERFTSITLRGLFRGKSVNTAGFLLKGA